MKCGITAESASPEPLASGVPWYPAASAKLPALVLFVSFKSCEHCKRIRALLFLRFRLIFPDGLLFAAVLMHGHARERKNGFFLHPCLLYTSPSPRD